MVLMFSLSQYRLLNKFLVGTLNNTELPTFLPERCAVCPHVQSSTAYVVFMRSQFAKTVKARVAQYFVDTKQARKSDSLTSFRIQSCIHQYCLFNALLNAISPHCAISTGPQVRAMDVCALLPDLRHPHLLFHCLCACDGLDFRNNIVLQRSC
jgi:hypothetical protein